MRAPDIDTIAAIATPPGQGGIGVVRVSGPGAAEVARAVLGRVPAERRATLADFLDDEGVPIDRGVALWFRAPASYTGEDTLELQGHGGTAVLDLVLTRTLSAGARLARPGEFTERAFLNDRLDLAQAEAVADLISAGSDAAARSAMRSLSGELSRRVTALHDRLVELRAVVESSLDFPDEELDPLDDDQVERALVDTRSDLRELTRRARHGARLTEGATIVIAGPPNAGKSTLLNTLSQEDRAIVTPIAGTTRDVLRVTTSLDGVPVELVDTAGLCDTDDLVEREGIARAEAEIARADLILVVTAVGDVDAKAPVPPAVPRIEVANKTDLAPPPPHFGLLPPGSPADAPRVAISARDGRGVDALRALMQRLLGVGAGVEGTFSARRRHLDALHRCADAIDDAVRQRRGSGAVELVADDLRRAQDALGAVTGRVTPDDLLGEIFSRFCIGK